MVLSKYPVNFDSIQAGNVVAPPAHPFQTYRVIHKGELLEAAERTEVVILEAGGLCKSFTPEGFNRHKYHRWENLCP